VSFCFEVPLEHYSFPFHKERVLSVYFLKTGNLAASVQLEALSEMVLLLSNLSVTLWEVIIQHVAVPLLEAMVDQARKSLQSLQREAGYFLLISGWRGGNCGVG
jgi:hypothetical protein